MSASPTLIMAAAARAEALSRDEVSLLADLAFGSAASGGDGSARHLALLLNESLELDLSDPQQRQFGDYELLELIGEGGMGVVYRARQSSLDRDVAIKLLAAGPWASREFIERFRREAQNAARMQHPNIVPIYEVGAAEDLHFFSMRLIRGPSVAAELKGHGRLGAARAARLLRTIAEAVDYAHRLGVLHLDLKPGNVLLDESGVPHVADFGLARRLEHDRASDSNEVQGTPSYMAPEQASPGTHSITAATDIWGLGAIAYELVTGEPPFVGPSAQATLALVVGAPLRSPRQLAPELPRDFEAIVLKCMAREPGARYATARDLADDASRFLEGRAVRARPLNAAQRAARWMRREPKLAATALLALVALLSGLAATTQQWRRAQQNARRAEQQRHIAEDNATQSAQRLWAERRDGALRLVQDGRGFDALLPLIANVEEQERAGLRDAAGVERREIGMIQSQGVALIDRLLITDASPMTSALSADGTLLAVGLNDVSVRWYDTATLRERGRVDLVDAPTSDGNPHVPQLLRFLDDHRLLVTLEWYDYSVAPTELDSILVDLDGGRALAPPDAFADFSHAQFASSGRYALLFNKSGQVQSWQVAPWRPLSPRPLTPMSEDYTLPYWLSRDGTIGLELYQSDADFARFDPRRPTQQSRKHLPAHVSLSAWAESRDGKQLALGDGEGRVMIVDVTTWQARLLPVPSGREVSWIAFSEDDAWLAVARVDGAAFAYDIASGTPLHSSQMQHDFALRHVDLSRRDRMLVASGAGETAVWRLPESGASGLPATRLIANPTHAANAGLHWASVSFQAGLLATADASGEVRLWRLPQARAQRVRAPTSFGGAFDGVHLVDVEWNHLRVAALGAAATPWTSLPQPVAFAELVDGARTLVATAGPQLHVLDARTLQPRIAPVNLPANPLEFAVDPAGRHAVLAFGANGGSGFRERLRAYDLAGGDSPADAADVAGPLRQFRLSDDGSRLVTVGGVDGATEVFDLASLRRVGRFPHDAEQPVVRAAFDGDDALWMILRAADPLQGDHGELLHWRASTGSVVEQRRLPGIWPVGLASDGGVPVVAARDQVIFDAGSPGARASARLPLGNATTVFAFSHDRRLVAHAFGRDVFLHDAATMAPLSAPLHTDIGLLDTIAELAFAADDRSLLCRTTSRKWFVWPVAADARPTADLRSTAALLTMPAHGEQLLLAVDPAEQRALRERDPGAWSQPEPRPPWAIARRIAEVAVPARPDGLDPLLLDLTAFYTTAPESSYNVLQTIMPNLYGAPFGTPRLDGVDYDLRGAVELRWGVGGRIGAERSVEIRNAMRGVRVPAVPIAAFHVLLFAQVPAAENKPREYATVVVRYRDGTRARLPIRTNVEIRGSNDLDDQTPIAWSQGRDIELGGGLRQRLVNNPRLANPHPERLIDSIDVEAFAHGWAAFVVLAITAEPVIAGAERRSASADGREARSQ